MKFIKRLKRCFWQGNNSDRREVLTAIMESIHEEYTEDNYYTRLYWIVEELLISDPEFKKYVNKLDLHCIKRGLSNVVDSVADCMKEQRKLEKV